MALLYVESYKTSFDMLQDDLLNSYIEAFQKGKLSVSQRRGIISLIPKEDNDLSGLTSWRPITLTTKSSRKLLPKE